MRARRPSSSCPGLEWCLFVGNASHYLGYIYQEARQSRSRQALCKYCYWHVRGALCLCKFRVRASAMALPRSRRGRTASSPQMQKKYSASRTSFAPPILILAGNRSWSQRGFVWTTYRQCRTPHLALRALRRRLREVQQPPAAPTARKGQVCWSSPRYLVRRVPSLRRRRHLLKA